MSRRLDLIKLLKQAGITCITTTLSGFQDCEYLVSQYVVGGGVPEELRSILRDRLETFAKRTGGFHAREAGSLCQMHLDLDKLEITWVTAENRYVDNRVRPRLFLDSLRDVDFVLTSFNSIASQMGDLLKSEGIGEAICDVRFAALEHNALSAHINDGCVSLFRSNIALDDTPISQGTKSIAGFGR